MTVPIGVPMISAISLYGCPRCRQVDRGAEPSGRSRRAAASTSEVGQPVQRLLSATGRLAEQGLGDQQLAELAEHRLSRLAAHLLRVLMNVFAETWIRDVRRAYVAFNQFSPGTLSAWLYRILANTFINTRRKVRREPAQSCSASSASC